MDPSVKSILTSVLLGVAAGAAGWMAKQGFIPAGDQSVISADIVSAVFGAGALAVGWYKARINTQNAMIKTINGIDNGVKVVPETSPTPAVNTTQK